MDADLLAAEMSREPYEHRGILHSEMRMIIALCREHGIGRVIESGRARGQSTYMLAKYLPECEIISVEGRETDDELFARERLKGFTNLRLYIGDGETALRRACVDGDQPTAVLCDGPKGFKAIAVIEKCFRNKHVRLGFIHDMRRLDHGGPSPYRAAAEAVFPLNQFSDDPELVAAWRWMDKNAVAANGPLGPSHEAEFGSYGPTIGAFINPQNQN